LRERAQGKGRHGPLLSKCKVIGKTKNPLGLRRRSAQLEGPVAKDAICDYKE
jgi:hypothetical protein